MTFLQPWVLVALPLAALPVIIHLINQRRFQTVPWAAMQFLLAAKALSRGYSRLRHWLILLLRMLAVAAVILAVGRPLSRGWLALAGGGRPDSAIVVLDRSPSMQARGPDGGESKLDTGRRQLADSLATLRAGRVLVVSDPVRGPEEVASSEAIADLATAGPTAAAADLPALLQSAYDFIRENAAGTTEVWICSDQRANDWRPDDGAWASIRDAFTKLPQQVRFQFLAYSAPATGNVALRVSSVRLETLGRDRRLVVTLAVSRQEDGDRRTLPVRFEIGGVTSAVDVELTGREAVLTNHVIPLERSAEAKGWGKVSISADANPADNDFFFVYAAPAERRTLVVAEDPAAGRVLELVAGIAPDKAAATVELVPPAGLATASWDTAAALLWQAPLPEGRDAEFVQAFVDRGGQVIFFPPDRPTAAEFAGGVWGECTRHAGDGRIVADRPGPPGQHARGNGTAVGRGRDSSFVQPRRRRRVAGVASRGRTAGGAVEPRRRDHVLWHDSRPPRLVARRGRHRALCVGAAGDRPGACGAGQRAASRRRGGHGRTRGGRRTVDAAGGSSQRPVDGGGPPCGSVRRR